MFGGPRRGKPEAGGDNGSASGGARQRGSTDGWAGLDGRRADDRQRGLSKGSG
jgi:hypothetical protein